MIRLWFNIIIFTLVFVLLQVLLMNNVHLFGIATPFIYLYAILKFPVHMNRSAVIILSFLIGLIIDMFSNTFGLHAAACTLLGFIRMPLLERFADVREMPEGSRPSYTLFGYTKYIRYTLILVAIHHVALFTIEAFGFFQPWLMFSRMLFSIVLTSMLILVIEAFNLGKVRSGE